MAKREMVYDVKAVNVIHPALVKADATGVAVDTQGFDSVTLIASVGKMDAASASTDKIDIQVKESDDKVTWADVDSEDLLGEAIALDNADKEEAAYKLGYRGNKRYVNVVAKVTGTLATGTQLGVIAMLGHAHAKPVA